jgi:hypothetical protein
MTILEPNNVSAGMHEVQVTIDAAMGYAEVVEIYKESENGPGFVQITSVQLIKPNNIRDKDNISQSSLTQYELRERAINNIKYREL